MDFDFTRSLAVLIPIVAIAMGIGLAMLSVWTDYRRKRELFELHHKERMLAIERGMEVPPLPPDFFRSEDDDGTPANPFRRGLTWLLVGIALTVALGVSVSLKTAVWGLVPVAVGLAGLISHAASSRNAPPAKGKENP